MQRIPHDQLDLAALLCPGDCVTWGQTGAEPVTLTDAFHAAAPQIGDLSAFVGISWGTLPDPDHVRVTTYCGTANNRRLTAGGRAAILPVPYSAFPRVLPGRVNVLMIQVAPGPRPGTYSWSMACEYLKPLLRSCRLVIAELNAAAPATGGEVIDAADIDILVATDRQPLTLPGGPAEDAITRAIADHVAGLVENGACLQIGLGALPDAIAARLGGHRDLGLHSGLINDSLARLIRSGVITNGRKEHRAGESVTGVLAGGADLLALAADPQSGIALAATPETHDPGIMAGLSRFTAINSAIEVEMTGQINAEVVGGRYLGAVGGGGDFLRGAALSPGGLPITALPSTVRMPDGRVLSRIVTHLSGPVTLARADAGLIVTEFGIADLRGADLDQRRARLAAVAHPDFRDTLAAGSEQESFT